MTKSKPVNKLGVHPVGLNDEELQTIITALKIMVVKVAEDEINPPANVVMIANDLIEELEKI